MTEISQRILFVDDDANLLEGLNRRLRKQFEIATARSGEAGLEILNNKGPFAVVVSDYGMPGMSGIEFLKKVGEYSPFTVSAMLTGQADLQVAVRALHNGRIFRFLSKPCSAEVLAKTIHDCLEQYRLVMMERILTDELNCANERLRVLNEELEDRVAKRTATIRRLHQFVSDLNGLDSLEAVAQVVVATTADMLQSRRVSLMLPDPEGEHLSIVAAVGVAARLQQRVRVPIGRAIAGVVFAESETIVVNDPNILASRQDRYDSDFFVSAPLVSSSLATPTGPVGVLNATERIGGRGYEEEALADLKAICEAAAIAIQNQIRLQQRNEARDATIFALAKLAENRDAETGAHLERVQAYCRLLGETMAQTPRYGSVIDRGFIENIVRSSPLHDIGKVGIPDHILLKPGRLTADEFKIMKRHSTIGGDTIRALVEKGRRQMFLQMGMEIAYHHHERFDGSGYPQGLAGEAIPLSARILALADVYDALTSRRVYKQAVAHEKAASIIRGDSGSHFDPDVVEAFFRREKEFERIAEERMDREDASPNKMDHIPSRAGLQPVASGT